MKKNDFLAPEHYNIVMEVEKFSRKDPDRIALIWKNEAGQRKTITYGQLGKNVSKISNVFVNKGLQKGDKIIVMAPRMIETYEVYLAAFKVGLIVIPCSDMFTTNDLQYRIADAKAHAVVTCAQHVEVFKGVKEYDELVRFVIDEPIDGFHFLNRIKQVESDEFISEPTSRDDIALLPYTSGTTGYPKGVVHTHGWGYAHLKTVVKKWLSIREQDIVWATAAPGWQKWVWSPFLAVLGSGATGFIYDGTFTPEKYLQMLQDENINVLCCTPTEYRFMAKSDHLSHFDLSSLHSAVSAGEPLNREVIEVFQETFNLTVRDGYGQTEKTLLLGIMKDMKVKPGSMGRPTPGNDVEVIDEGGNPVDVNIVGDIAVTLDSPSLFKKYYNNPEKTRQSRRGQYYVTGDRAYKDEEGYFWFVGRSDDIIVSSGYSIGPFEVEDALTNHPYVKECAVIAKPHEFRGQIVKAYVVLHESSEDVQEKELIKSLQDHVKSYTAPYKYPREIEFIDELPKTVSGKIRRVELREREQNR